MTYPNGKWPATREASPVTELALSKPPALNEDVEVVPVLRPQLPSAERLLPYLQRIDATRIYSNWGPLSSELESRLAMHLQLPPAGITSASSGSAALVGAILAAAGPARADRPLALVPAFTFVATAAAVEQCGYEPYLADVGRASWMLEPELLAEHPALDRIGLVVPVAPYGRPVPQQPWRDFRKATGVPVVIDGAAGFDRAAEAPELFFGDVPVAMSFHATKCFATGEGGGVASTDLSLVTRTGQALNFGFHMTRESRSPSINGKMSEYHAAVGLAELDDWPAKLASLRAVAERYRTLLARAGCSDRLVATPDIGASYVLFQCRDMPEAARVQDSLTRARVDYRLWYERGLHHHARLSQLPRDDLDATEDLGPRLLGVPLAPDLSASCVERVVDALARGVTGSR